MKKIVLALFCAAMFAGLASTTAYADAFNFTFTGPTDSGYGVFTASSTGTLGTYLITGVTGMTDGSPIAALLGVNLYPASNGFASNDNLLYFPAAIVPPNSGPAYLDLGGVSYSLQNGTNVNLYYGQFDTGTPQIYNLIAGAGETNFSLSSFSVAAAAPEPGSLALLGTGVLGLVGMLRRRYEA